MPRMDRRVVMIGLDMADANLIEAWAGQGVLPTLRSIMADGSWGRLRTTAEILHTSTWPTIFTGTLPGKHGVYYPYQPCPGRQKARAIGPDQYGQPPFWSLLDRAGQRCIVFDAPETFPVDGFGGVQIFEWSTWAWYWRRMTSPEKLEGELRRRFGPSRLQLEARRLGFATPDHGTLRRQLVDSVAAKSAMVRWLMRNRAWDAFVVVFAEPHAAGHYLWPRHAGSPAVAAAGVDDAATASLRAVYAAVDTAIGEVLGECGDDATLVVVSGDGVGPNHCGWHLLPEVLGRAGFTRAATSGNGAGTREVRTLLQRVRDAVPPSARAAVSARLPWRLRDRVVSRMATDNVEWSRSAAFCLPTDLEGCIRINLKGREPHGIVEPGHQYEDVCAEVTKTLTELLNPVTGEPAVRGVWRVDRCFPGDRRHHLPDLAVAWASGAEIQALYSDRLGLVQARPVDPRTGTHHPQSFVALRGPRVRRGPLGGGGHIADLAPTVLSCLEVAPSSAMDGKVLEAVSA